MKQEELDQIQKLLRAWCKERHLTVGMQITGLLGNILEELTEGVRANTEEERVDAICDILVFTLNAQANNLVMPSYKLSHQTGNTIDISFCTIILECLFWGVPEKIVALCSKQLKNIGYNPYLCMLETIKEISSRSGSYNESMKKFVKNPGAYSIEELEEKYKHIEDARVYEVENGFEVVIDREITPYVKWVKADYSKCKLVNENE